MFRRRAATATDNIDQPRFGKFTDQSGHVIGTLIITAHLIGQTGIGVTGDIDLRHPR